MTFSHILSRFQPVGILPTSVGTATFSGFCKPLAFRRGWFSQLIISTSACGMHLLRLLPLSAIVNDNVVRTTFCRFHSFGFNSWSGTLTLRLTHSVLALCLFSLSIVVRGTSIPAPSTLRTVAQARRFYVGAAVAVSPLLNSKLYQDTLSNNYNMVVPENVMKWDATEPRRGVFDFTAADSIVSFAKANNMQVRGHNLVWHQQLPGWLTGETYSRDALLQILHDHITGLVSHFKGQILDWDVVNEGIAEDGTLRKSLWYQGIGPDYIEQAFRFAHEADPDAKLFYNDYGGEGSGKKADVIYAMVRDLKQKGVPIDGVGLQMHVGIGPYESSRPADIAANMQRLVALSLEVQITEMDVKTQNGTGSDSDKLTAQAKLYGDILRVCLQQKGCTAFLTWGFTDLFTWIPGFTHHPDAPLPFDKAYQPKPAYQSLLNVLSEPIALL